MHGAALASDSATWLKLAHPHSSSRRVCRTANPMMRQWSRDFNGHRTCSEINPFFPSMLATITKAAARRSYDILLSFQQLGDNWIRTDSRPRAHRRLREPARRSEIPERPYGIGSRTAAPISPLFPRGQETRPAL